MEPFLTVSVATVSSTKFASADMDVQKAGMARLFLAAPDLRGSAWMMQSPAFRKLCEAYEHACLRRDLLRCSALKDEGALLRSETECKSLEAAAIAYIRKQRQLSGLA
ncbi:hypothetical protein CN151_31285 [Sinorhizobium meliloti]|uniref:Uncharacterized protein n=3 Tax=Rhizobium meliloti TaxID=382 RepID=Q92PM5_RHIME|nr:hypothetical protein SM11_chr1691 [Sinorhizobium meliloti SM11]AGG74298.1 Hypothetical protein SM2011_c04866 [Sinorhizobium meliloti 2011]ARS71985.1 hypothetical protein SMRU11_34520 [Sinorhizobium meliloti RU11/001]ASJ59436.1 hypothetical protein SMB554_09645 [Sinorhizobium meliloti]PST25700.1 hypothetical protein C7U62_13705 [Mesorhizobium loti]CAC46293.1 Hypothetical protein SMc04866 [Sinorhizobium meliloti 1021]